MNKIRSSFLSDFFGPLSGEKIYISALANDSTLKGRFPPKQIASVDPTEIDTFIANHDIQGRGVFFCVSPIRGDAGASKNKDAVSSLVCLHADIDFKSIVGNHTSVLADLKKLWHEPTYTVLSGHGVHIYYLFSMPLIASPESVVRVENAARRLADVVGGDRQVAEVSRVMRMPGTCNSKDPDNVVLCEVIASSGKRYALSDLVTWLGTQEPVIERVAKADAPPPPSDPKVLNFFSQFGAEHARGESLDLDSMWESMFYPGNVHETEVRVIASLLSRGENVDNAIAFVIQGITDHIPEAATWNLEREQRELRKMAVGWFVKHPDLMELQIDPPAWLMANRDIRSKVLPNVKLAPSTVADTPKPGPQTGAGSRVVDFTPSHTNGTARKMDEPPQGEIEQEENAVDKESDPAPEKAKADGATIHEFPKGGERVHLKTVPKAEPVPDIVIRWGEEIEQDEVKGPEWVVEGYVMKGALNGYFGDGGVGKDLTLQQLCTAVATGNHWLGMPVTKGRAFYMNVEDNWQMMRYRMDAMQRYYGITFKDYPESFMAASMVGQSTLLATIDPRSGVVKPTPLYEKLRKILSDFRPDLIVVGNRVNIFNVNQNDDAQARQCLELLNALILEFGTTIIMPGHVSNSGMQNNTGMSGSVQWNNGVRNRMFLSKIAKSNDEEASDIDLRTRHLTVMKANWSKDGAITKIAWDDRFGLFVPVNEAEGFETEALPVGEQSKRADAEFVRMLGLLNDDASWVSANAKSPSNYAPRVMVRDRRCAYHRKPINDLEDAMRQLKDRGVIDLVPYGPPSANTKRLIVVQK